MKLLTPNPRQGSVLKVLLLAMLLITTGMIWAGVSLVRSVLHPHNMPALQMDLIGKLHLATSTQVEVTAPPLLLTLAGWASRFIDVEPEARDALRSVRTAQVKVYELTERPAHQTRMELLKTANEHLNESGWERVAWVMDKHDMVLVYLSNLEDKPDAIEVCVLVLNDRNLVMVGGSGRLDAMTDLVSTIIDRHGNDVLAAMR